MQYILTCRTLELEFCKKNL